MTRFVFSSMCISIVQAPTSAALEDRELTRAVAQAELKTRGPCMFESTGGDMRCLRLLTSPPRVFGCCFLFSTPERQVVGRAGGLRKVDFPFPFV